MTRLLHVSASPRAAKSESLALAELYLDTVTAAHPEVQVVEWDLWDGTLPEFGAAAVEGKMNTFAGVELDGPAAAAWRQVVAAYERFADADAYLFSVPMWNASVPYKLKQLIDVVSQPGLVFGFDPLEGYTGQLTGRTAAVVYTSAIYGEGRGPSFGADFQQPFFRDWLEWSGITDVSEAFFRPNIATADADAGRRQAQRDVVAMAHSFRATPRPAERLAS